MRDKIHRNGFCPCGSGKKYKKCCLIKKEQLLNEFKAIEEKLSAEDIECARKLEDIRFKNRERSCDNCLDFISDICKGKTLTTKEEVYKCFTINVYKNIRGITEIK